MQQKILIDSPWTLIIRGLFQVLWAIPAFAQATKPVIPQGVAVLTQSLSASGAANPQNLVKSFTASGTVTFFWAGKQVQAPATIRANGSDQFRLDASLASGTRSFAVSHNSGALKDETGKLTAIPLHNTLTFGIPSFPYPQISTALSDPTVSVSYVGAVQSGGRQLNQVHVAKTFSKESDPQGIMAGLTTKDYFVDAQTNLVAKTQDLIHPVETFTKSYPHEMDLENYTTMNGVAVPTLVREKINGQTIWEFHLSAITFNTNLNDADFSLQ